MATLKDIAKAAQVSIPAVSSVLNAKTGSVRVGAEARERIHEVARRLNYVKNDLARSVQNGVSNFIAFVDVQAGDSEHSNRILNGVVSGLQNTKYSPKFFPYGTDRDAIDNISTVFGQKPAGVLAVSRGDEYMQKIASFCESHNVPQVTIGQSIFWGQEVIVSPRDKQGQTQAVEHLYLCGHRKIGHLSSFTQAVYSERREQGYTEGMNKCCLADNITVLRGDLYKGEEFNHSLELDIQNFLRKTRVTAITCVSDMHAMVVIRAASRMGLKVPEGLSVVGHANFRVCLFANPPLTTIAEPFEEMGKRAVKEILECIDAGKMSSRREIKLPTSLIERESVNKI